MTARDIVMASAGTGPDKTYIEDVFSTYLYTGNGSTQTINNGIDLAGKGGMVWIKCRNSPDGNTPAHGINDTVRGTSNAATLCTNTNGAAGEGFIGTMGFTSFNSNGFSLSGLNYRSNSSAGNYASWTFRKAPKFFDVVTWTGDGVAGRTISHSLGQAPGMIIVKCTNISMPWAVYHKNIAASNPEYYYMELNSAVEAQFDSGKNWWNWTQPTSSAFTVGGGTRTNNNGYTYVAYLFAHDTTTDGLIQCGSFTSNSSGLAKIDLGWEPQYVMIKRSNGTGDWVIRDVMRGLNSYDSPNALSANLTGAEPTGTERFYLNGWGSFAPQSSNGFSYSGTANASFIYMAIRRPMKVPTDGTKVFKPIANMGYTGSAITTGFPYDLTIWKYRNDGGDYWRWEDRLRGINTSNSSTGMSVPTLYSNNTNAESSGPSSTTYGANNTGGLAGSYGADPQVLYTFKRAPGFFDVVCFTGNGSSQTVNHNLGTAPELMIIKNRAAAGDNWFAGCLFDDAAVFPNFQSLLLNTAGAAGYQSYGGGILNSKPTASSFALGSDGIVNRSSNTYVSYLFASCPGVSKVGTYTGNGSSQTINCGFTNGARFVLIKKTSGTDNWYVWDSARGITSGNDPFVLMNSTSSEYTSYDTIDPDPSGFIVNQEAIGQNSSGAEYLYLAIA